MKIIALMIVRNEEACLPRCLEYLGEQGLRAAVIDNESTDRTADILAAFSPQVVLRVEQWPFHGIFAWNDLLQQAERMRAHLTADWFHLNSPDEIMGSTRKGESLRDAIQRVDQAGYDVINYEEFVFLPTDQEILAEGPDFDRLIRHYYFYAPAPRRQMRSWKNRPGRTNLASGGHQLEGAGLRLYPENLVMRHFIALSADQFRRKYAHRIFPAEELARGWHANRTNIDINRIRLPARHLLKEWAVDDPSTLDRSDPWTCHFWERPKIQAPGMLESIRSRLGAGMRR